MQPLYELAINNQTLLEVRMQAQPWLPERPRLKAKHIRFAIRDALSRALRN